jgi:hypothetical protein
LRTGQAGIDVASSAPFKAAFAGRNSLAMNMAGLFVFSTAAPTNLRRSWRATSFLSCGTPGLMAMPVVDQRVPLQVIGH